MKLIKLLLTGLLSVGALLSCGDNGVHISTKAELLKIVGVTSQVTPVLFDNVTIMIRAVDQYGNQVKSVTWEATELVHATLITTAVDDTTATEGIVMLKVTNADATGTITAKARIDDNDVTAEYQIVTSEEVLRKINVSPTNPNIALFDGDTDIQLKAVATFGTTIIDVTKDVKWEVIPRIPPVTTPPTPPTPIVGVDVNNTDQKGLVTISVEEVDVKVRATLISNNISKNNETTLSSMNTTIKSIKIKGASTSVPIMSGEKVQLSAIATFNEANNILPTPLDITKKATWSSSVESVATVGNTILDKGLLEVIDYKDTSVITAIHGTISDTLTITATTPEPTLMSFALYPPSTSPSEADTVFDLDIRETLITIGSETPANNRDYTCEIVSGTGVVLADSGTTCDKLKTGIFSDSLTTTIKVTNTIQSDLGSKTIVITPTYTGTPPILVFFTVAHIDNATLNTADMPIVLEITETYDSGVESIVNGSTYTCEIGAGDGTSVTLEDGETTCDKLKVSRIGSGTETKVEITKTSNPGLLTDRRHLVFQPTFTR